MRPEETTTLIAYLDGEGDDDARATVEARLADDIELRAEAARLESVKLELQDGFAALLDVAPQERLNALLQEALAKPPTSLRRSVPPGVQVTSANKPSSRWFNRQAQFAAATIAIFLLGTLLGSLLGVGPSPNRPPENWRQAVAEYWSLTTPQTLAIAPDGATSKAELAAAGDALGLNLASAETRPAEAAFRGSELYQYHGRPLVQIAYLDPTYGPIAYCIITDPTHADRAKTNETIDGFNLVHWAKDGHARLLIGRAPPEVLQRYAATLDG